MSFSWSNGTCRWGAIVLVIHDTCDYWMEGAKLALYMKVCAELALYEGTCMCCTNVIYEGTMV